LVELLRNRYGNEAASIRLFGSRARGEFTSDSDIDLMILFDCEIDWRFRDKINRSISPLNVKNDVFHSARISSTTMLREERIQALQLVEGIQQDGLTIQ